MLFALVPLPTMRDQPTVGVALGRVHVSTACWPPRRRLGLSHAWAYVPEPPVVITLPAAVGAIAY